MLQLTLQSNTHSLSGKAELFADYQEGSVGISITTDKDLQFDFNMDKSEWELFKQFIDNSINQEVKTEKDV